MRNSLLLLFSFCFLFLSCFSSNAAFISIENLSFSLELEEVSIEKLSLFGSPFPGKGKVTFFDGEKEFYLKESEVCLQREREAFIYKHSFIEKPSLRATHLVTPKNNYISYKITLNNLSKEEMWIEVGLSLPYSFKRDYSYWDGFQIYSSPDKILSRDDLRGMFPLAAIYQKNGLALGIEPHQLRSYLKVELNPSTHQVFFATRMVIDPEGKDEIEFILFPFENNFGYLDAVQVYYDCFPDIFVATPGIDPRIKKPCASHLYWNFSSHFGKRSGGVNTFELLRKAGAGCDWCYGAASGARQGDYWPSELTKKWLGKFRKVGKTPPTWPNPENWIEEMFFRLEKGRIYNIAPMAYSGFIACEEELAKKYFPEAILVPKDGKVKIWRKSHAFGNQPTLFVYPYRNSFGEKTIKDFEKIAKNWPISGFAFDTGAGRGIRHFGKGTEGSPGKAYEKGKGVYATVGTAIAMVAKEVHSFYRDGLRMGIIVNLDGAQGYYAWLTADSAIYEASPQFHLYGYDPIHVRLWLGKKPVTWWRGWSIPDWKSFSPEELRKSFSALIDYTILYSLYLCGYPPPTYSLGVPKVLHYMPILIDLTDLGWEPAPGFKADKRLWLSRYGKELGSCLVLGNCTLKDIQTEIKLNNSYLGPFSYVLAEYEGEKEITSQIKGKDTIISEDIKARTPLILRTIAGIDKGHNLSFSSKINLTTGEKGFLDIEIISGKNFSGSIYLWLPKGTYPESLLLNGQRCKFFENDNSVVSKIRLSKGKNNLILNLSPEIEIKNMTSLLEFPFIKNKEPNCKILIAKDAATEEEVFASWVSNYFSFYHQYALRSPLKKDIQVGKEKEGYSSFIIIGTPESNPLINKLPEEKKGFIYKEGENLIIAAKDLHSLKETTLLLLEALDKEYAFYGYFTGFSGFYRKIPPSYFKASPDAKALGIEKEGYFPWKKN